MNSNNKIKHRYNPDYFHQQAISLLDTVSPEDAAAWYHHPCTKSLLSSLEGDLAGLVVLWLGGGFSNEDNVDVTSQRTAKARGMAQSIEDVMDHINNIRKLSIRGEHVSHGDEASYTS